MSTTTTIARGTEWSNNFCNAGLGGFRDMFDCPAVGKRAAEWVVDRFNELCADAGHPEVSWISGTSEVYGEYGVDYSDIDLDELREQAYSEFDADEIDEPTIDDLEPDDIEWNGCDENSFTFPKWLPDHDEAQEHYETLAEYNVAYEMECTDINNDSYKLYARIRRLIDDKTPGLRIKNDGPYNPEGKKIILSCIVAGHEWLSFWPDESKWAPVSFSECEETYMLCKALKIDYPYPYDRPQRIGRVVNEWIATASPELPGLISARNSIITKMRELEIERDRLCERIEQEQAVRVRAETAAAEWRAKMTAR